MPLSFLAPVFLAALAALAVPVLVHLIQRERRDAVRFPSLMFLSQVPYKSTRRRRIRNWWLFVLRSLALLLIVAAFARPLIEGELDASSPLAVAREVVILTDRSYSMGYGDRWDRARAAAAAVIDGLGPDDRATIVFFDGGATAASPASGDRVRLRAALDERGPGSGVTRYGPAAKLAQSILDASDQPRREVVLISDFQRAGWDGGEGVRLPAGTEVTPVAITDDETRNLAVAGVTLRREEVGERERVTATARIVNAGDEPAVRLPVTLQLNGRDLETRNLDVAANDAANVTFAPFTVAARDQRATIRVATDRLPADDAFHFVLSPGQAVRVLLADGGGPRANLYLERALGIGDRPRFRPVTKRAESVRAADLADTHVVIWNDAVLPAGETGRRLRSFVEAGGGLILLLGPRGDWDAGRDLVPGLSVGRALDRADPGGALGYIEYGHPIFELFRAPRSGDLSAARFFRYRPVEPSAAATVLARFDDGAPALLEASVGAGRILIWTSTLDNFWTDLPVQPVFLPLVHQLVQHAAGYVEPDPWFTAGQVVEVGGRTIAAADSGAVADSAGGVASPSRPTDRVAITPSGERVAIESGLLRLEEAGFYQIRQPGGADRAIAVNVDLAESDLSALDPQEVVGAIRPRAGQARTSAATTVRAEDRERRQALWWYLLILAFILLAAETAFSNRLSRRQGAAAEARTS